MSGEAYYRSENGLGEVDFLFFYEELRRRYNDMAFEK